MIAWQDPKDYCKEEDEIKKRKYVRFFSKKERWEEHIYWRKKVNKEKMRVDVTAENIINTTKTKNTEKSSS